MPINSTVLLPVKLTLCLWDIGQNLEHLGGKRMPLQGDLVCLIHSASKVDNELGAVRQQYCMRLHRVALPVLTELFTSCKWMRMLGVWYSGMQDL